ncbi:hypothetical protein FACHB389_10680 [Nostoc calcicola FACHB-389]|nr:hypothetical protein [Nostoc calcicola FACHB-3891]OKH36970.1 hypothetical protein FACHB389_10680 [Nostoc calcicola FACHB-389]
MSQDLENEVQQLRSEVENLKLEEKKKSVRNALYKAGVDDAHIAVKAFGLDHDLKSLDLTNINQLVADWKNTGLGSKFFTFQPDQQKETSNQTIYQKGKTRDLKDLSKQLKEGTLKLKVR